MRPIVEFTQRLFARGLEGYDAAQRATPTKGVLNAGGAKVFSQTFKATNSRLSFNNKALFAALSSFNVVLYTVNRIDLDENGQPKRVRDGADYDRVDTGLMAYVADASPDMGMRLKDRILEALKPLNSADFQSSDYLEVATQIPDPDGKIAAALKEVKYRNFVQANVAIAPKNLVIMAFPSGQAGSQALWTLQSSTMSNRPGVGSSSAANAMESGEMPF